MSVRHTLKLSAIAFAISASVLITACADMGHMRKSDIPTDQNPAHDMHKTQGS